MFQKYKSFKAQVVLEQLAVLRMESALVEKEISTMSVAVQEANEQITSCQEVCTAKGQWPSASNLPSILFKYVGCRQRLKPNKQ